MFYPGDAFIDTIRYLWLHLIVCAGVALIFALGSLLKNRGSLPAGLKEQISWFAAKYISTLAFGFLGLLTAYFLSRGIDRKTGVNSFTTGLAVAIVPAISAGIAFLEKSPADNTKPRSGIAAFLVVTLICYQMLVFQTTAFYPRIDFNAKPLTTK